MIQGGRVSRHNVKMVDECDGNNGDGDAVGSIYLLPWVFLCMGGEGTYTVVIEHRG